MDRNLTGRSAPPPEGPRARAISMRHLRSRPALIAGLAVVLLAAAIALAGSGVFASAAVSPAPSRTSAQIAAISPAPTFVPTPTATPTATPTPTPTPAPTSTGTPTPTPATPPLPALLGAIGDSYTTAFSVSPQLLYDHRQYSWAVGTAKNDGVLSLLERFRALGDLPVVADAATMGRRMSDAPRQAGIIVSAAKKLGPGKTAYVTFELGTNDLCGDPMTAPATFQGSLRAALDTLKTGLPAGSRILMLAVPDFPHFYDMTQADSNTKAALLLTVNSNRCPPYLGDFGSPSVDTANYYLTTYDSMLQAGCTGMNTGAGMPRVSCIYDPGLLSESDFVAKDLSTADYFHPSFTGQAKMAESAWLAGPWASVPLP
jgi:lysophospholipase L1-like esterase